MQESPGPVSRRNVTGPVPASHFQTRFRSSTDVTDNILGQNQPGSDLVLADCARFWPNGSGPEASQCARIIRPASGQPFPANPDRMRIGSGMFTGYILLPQSYQLVYPNLPEGADRVDGQLRRDKECSFSGVTNSGRVPESDVRSVHKCTSPEK